MCQDWESREHDDKTYWGLKASRVDILVPASRIKPYEKKAASVDEDDDLPF